MSVAKKQIVEVLRVIQRYAPNRVVELLTDLKDTEAYKSNRSYRETIDRLYEQQLIGWS